MCSQGRSQVFIGGGQAGGNINLSIETFSAELRKIVLLIFKRFKCLKISSY